MKAQSMSLARRLRHHETDAERKLWWRIRNRQIDGWKFRRQVPYEMYVLDFYCFEAGLVIEVDGSQHIQLTAAHDAARTQLLEANGLQVLRFWNADVLSNIDAVLETIYLSLGQRQAPSPGALKRQYANAGRLARRPLPKGRGTGRASLTVEGEK